MELKLLRSFVVLSEELHFGRAANRLCIVQPALSAQIRSLEGSLGVRLFERDRHHVELSEAGRSFLPGAKATLEQAQRAIDRVVAVDRGEVGRVRIAFISSVLPWFLPSLVRRLRDAYPQIDLDLKDMPSPEQLRGLRDGLLDFGFVRLPVETTGLTVREIFQEPYVVALPEGHPLSARLYLTAGDLQGEPCFMLGRRFAPGFHDELCLALADYGLTLKIDREFGEFTTMIAFVAAGMGIGLLPRLALTMPPPGVTLRSIDLGDRISRVGLASRDLETAVERNFHRLAMETAAIGTAINFDSAHFGVRPA